MNFVKKSLVGGIRDGIEVLEGVKALLLPISYLSTRLWGPVSSFCSLVGLARGFLQGFCQAQDFEAIVIKI